MTDGNASAQDEGGIEADAAGVPGDASTACARGYVGADCRTCVRYVDPSNRAATQDGLSWQSAFVDIITAMVDAENTSAQNLDPNTPYCQVWVREGIFRLHAGSAANTIPLSPIVPLYGSFAGTERDPSQRDLARHVTILDGADSQGVNHVYHPVYSTSGGLIDGFTIRGGRANAAGTSPHADGGGLRVSGGMLTVRNVVFDDNTTTGNGGAIFAQNAVLTIDGCRFTRNTADKNGGAVAVQPVGAGNSATLVLTTSELRSNVAGGNGGAVFTTGSVTSRLENLVIAENTAGGAAGGIYVTAGQVTLVASTLDANDAGSTASELLFSCTSGTCSALNSIFWDGSTLPALSLTRATVSHSIVRGGATGTAISSADPRFVAEPSDLHLSAGSPAIDAADGCSGPERDRDGLARRDIPTVTDTGVAPVFSDRGAYEYQLGGSPYAAFSTLCP